jgi:hypothetical protein
LSAFAVAFLSSTIWGGAQASAGEFSKLRSDLDGMSAVKLAADIVTSAPACASPSGELVCDRTTGQWLFALKANPSFSANTIKIVGTAPGVSVANGPLLPLGNPVTTLQLSGAFQGKSVAIDMCLFDKQAMESGQPFDCCKITVVAEAPAQACVKK